MANPENVVKYGLPIGEMGPVDQKKVEEQDAERRIKLAALGYPSFDAFIKAKMQEYGTAPIQGEVAIYNSAEQIEAAK